MIFHQVAVDIPLPTLFTYQYHEKINAGQRVLVSFANKKTVGIVWESDVETDYPINKILPIESVFATEPVFDSNWRELIVFASQYYFYPIGKTVFSALPKGLRQNKAVKLPQEIAYYTLSTTAKTQQVPLFRSTKQQSLWQALSEHTLNIQKAKQIYPQAKKCIEKWSEQGHIIESNAIANVAVQQSKLNIEQQQVYQCITNTLDTFQAFLLFGITGSGKTETYFEVMAKVLSLGKQVLFLLPEINLTPQLLLRLEKRFPDIEKVVLHSQMADGMRTQNYLKAMLGKALLIIGTRLSVFTPMHNLGLLVVDEEHDHSFKQNSELLYNARDLAVWRAKQANCPIILGSATPSLESWHACKQNKYQLVTLTKRANPRAQLPEIILYDVSRKKLNNGFSDKAIQLLQENYQQGGLSLVYLNRRGFAPVLACVDCGFSFSCPHCASRLVLHKKIEKLRCHHCDYQQNIPHFCPDCGNQDLTAVGQGTQRVEETLRFLMPQARIVRVDRDSIARKGDWQNIYEKIHEQEIDILIGTQLLAKGHDFAKLNLIIVLNADNSLYSADFRAPEHLFAELMQVSGRAGRAEYPGRVFIQTQLPEHRVLCTLQQQNYTQFADSELDERMMFSFPPCIYCAAIRVDALTLNNAMEFLEYCKTVFNLSDDVNIMGPSPQLMMRLAGRERAQLFLESHSRKSLHKAIHQCLEVLMQQQKQNQHIRFRVDVDPYDA